MSLPKATFVLPYATLIAVGASLYAAAFMATALPDVQQLAALGLAGAAGLAAVAVFSAAAIWRVEPRRAVRAALAPSLLFAAGYSHFLIVERDLARLAIAVAMMGLIGAYLLVIEGVGGPSPRYVEQDLAHLAFALRVVSFFSGFAFLIDLPSLAGTHPAWSALAAAVFAGALAWDACWHEGFPDQSAAPVALLFALLGGEYEVAAAFLPILPIVGAALGVTLFTTALNASVLALKGARPSRASLAFAAAVAAAILATARWN